jgi:acyl carrier protein
MDDTRNRLVRCFAAVFPSLPADSIARAGVSNTEGWDSVASVTLVATIEEEFGIELDIQDLAELISFEKILDYLQQNPRKAGD